MSDHCETLCIKELKLVIEKVSAPLLPNVDSNRKNNMKLKVIKDEDGIPRALLTNLFKFRNCQKHDSLIGTLYAHDFRMFSFHVRYSYATCGILRNTASDSE